LGKNGAGKTTLLKIMAGLLFPMGGKATFDGIDITKREPGFLEEIFFLPEEFYLPPVTGEVFTSLRSPLYPHFDEVLFREFIKDFDVDITKKLNSLSFGQKKKFLLSFGLATGTKIIIMDEPTNALDIPSKTILRKNIAKAMNEDRTILISTHQVKDVENLIDPIIVLENGKIVFNQSIESISNNLSMKKVQNSQVKRFIIRKLWVVMK
jgi:ABC-2 type transport system ATP-binding protein